jgi:probable H4MPT-linked C1 transfer pathway protein
MNWLGLDIGGANLKAATASGWAHSAHFALWRDPDSLAAALQELIRDAPAADGLAVTMTGELCDCFRSKADGVRHIVSAVESVAANRKVAVYFTDGRFASCSQAKDSPRLAAASNWRALAELACRYVECGLGLLIDIGSTTTDIIPIQRGVVAARGRTDTERLIARELVYTGVGRTPVCVVVRNLPWGETTCPVAAEVFSTTADAYLLLGKTSEDRTATGTADGKPLTIEFARQRLGRQICEDVGEFPESWFARAAAAIKEAQQAEVSQAVTEVIAQMAQRPAYVVVSGSGEFLARDIANSAAGDCRMISLEKTLGIGISRAAPAYAVAVLAGEAAGTTVSSP